MKTLYIVDDDTLYRLILTRTITRLAPDVVIEQYEHGEAALEALQKIADNNLPGPDVILLDINMPVMDGWQFLEGLEPLRTRITGNMTIYIASTSLDERDRQRALNIDLVKEYLYKPVSAEKLLELLSR